MFPLIETALAFATAMLAASLLVSAAVQMLQKLGRYRSHTVREMLEALMHGFRVYHNDPEILKAEDEEGAEKKKKLYENTEEVEETFAEDIMSDPALHERAQKLKYRDNTEQLAKLVEYIDKDDLEDLAENYSKYYSERIEATQKDSSKLPIEWVGTSKNYATVDNLKNYIAKMFKTFEGTAAESFKMRIRGLTLVVSVTLVILINLDGINLLKVLHHNGSGRTALIQQAETLGITAERLGIAEPDLGESAGSDAESGTELNNTNKQLLLEMQKTATILDEADIGIGWQKSWIVKRWAAYKGVGDSNGLPPTGWGLFFDTFRWLGGLLFSCVMLSLGAPFWYKTLSKMINIKNQVQQNKEKSAEENAKG